MNDEIGSGGVPMDREYQSADLILKLYDLRREPVLRKAREWYRNEFTPKSADDVVAALSGEHSASFRMVTSYWEMAASFVTRGVIDWDMFMQANPGEPFDVFMKLYPFLPELRARFESKYDDKQALQHLENILMKLPHAELRFADALGKLSQRSK